MIQITDKRKCTGCSVCANVCPFEAIAMKEDEESFLYPHIEADKCKKCGLCDAHCPVSHMYLPERIPIPSVYAGWSKNDEIRMQSTTGGIFYELASAFIENGGYVCGVVWTNDWSAKHFISNKKEDLKFLMGSKYIQSNKNNIYKTIKKLLEASERVMICSLPCETAGLYTYLGRDYDNLFVVDMLCRGVNAPGVLKKFLMTLEKKYQSHVESVHFKCKRPHGWHGFSTEITFANGHIYNRDRYTDQFMRCYLQENCSIRPSCSDCRFKSVNGYGDITIGDFWGIEYSHPELDENKGTSMIKINTQKGQHYFEELSENIYFQKCSLEDANTKYNSCFSKSVPMGNERDEFFQDYLQLPFEDVLKKYVPDETTIQIIKKKIISLLSFMKKAIFAIIGIHGMKVSITLLWRLNNKKIKGNSRGIILPMSYSRISLGKNCRIECDGKLIIGKKENPMTRQETSVMLKDNAVLVCHGTRVLQTGCDIRLWPGARLEMGDGYFNNGVQIVCQDNIKIGNDVVVARDVVIRDSDAHMLNNESYQMKKPVVIKDHVWIGMRAMILKGVTIGEGAVIAAGSIVTRDVPPHSLVAGVPAKVIRENVIWYY